MDSLVLEGFSFCIIQGRDYARKPFKKPQKMHRVCITYITLQKLNCVNFLWSCIWQGQISNNQQKLKTNVLIKIFLSVYKQSSSFSKIAKLKDLQSRNRCYTFLANQTKQIPNCDKYTSVEYVYKWRNTSPKTV